ncbi:hypothetical protein [Mycobacterium kyorinense]|nr:hypothetical protein [Mycobacterium kyorinense]
MQVASHLAEVTDDLCEFPRAALATSPGPPPQQRQVVVLNNK